MAVVDPAIDYVRPDVEALVWATVNDLRSMTTWGYTAVALPAPIGWLVATSVQVDARGSTKKAAYDRACAARQRLLALPWADWPEGVVTGVDIIEDAWWNPDLDGAPRYTARYEVRAHPRPATRKAEST
jgi:hypothetical protein